MRLDPTGIIRLLRETDTRPYQVAKQILLAQVKLEAAKMLHPLLDLSGKATRPEACDLCDEILEPEVCDLCGNPPGPGHEGCNRAIEAGLD